MSGFDEPNADAYMIGMDEGARGPRLGFQDAFAASLDAQRKVHSMLGLQQSFRDVEQAQIKRMRDAGLEPHKSLDDSEAVGSGPFGGAQFNQGRYAAAASSIVDGGGWYTDDLVKERDGQIERAKKEHPELGLQTYSEMFKGLQDKAQDIERRNSLPTSTMGAVGGFLGGAVGSMDPVTNPLALATAPLAGGASIPARMAVQGAVQGGVEALDIATNDNARLLTGHQATMTENLKRIGLATAGGVGFQGLLEGGGLAVNRMRTGKWFNDLPADKLPTREPTPPQPTPDLLPGERMAPGRPINEYPDFDTFAQAHGVNVEFERALGPSREARSRTVADRDYVTAQLDRWDGPQPHEIPARTEGTPPPNVEPGVRYEGGVQSFMDRMETVDDVARRLDPDLFAKYDKLAAQRDELRAAIERGREVGDLRPEANRPDIKAQFEAERAARELSTRQQIMRVDEQMRDMAPLVSRAMGAAEREWRATPVDFNALNYLKNLEQRTGWRYRGEDKASLTEQPLREKAPEAQPPTQTMADKVPLSRLSPEQTAKLRPNSDTADRVAIATADAIEAVDAKIEHFVKAARTTAKLEMADVRKQIVDLTNKIKEADAQRLNGNTAEQRRQGAKNVVDLQKEMDALQHVTLPDGSKLHLDNDKLPGPDGKEVTVRDFLREMDKDQHALDAVVTCSRPS